MILFLDFDGVLHPSQVVMGEHGPALIGDGEFREAAEFGQTGTAALVIVGRREVHRR